VTIPVKQSQGKRHNLDPEYFFINRFWGRRPDGVAINEALQVVCILEFKQSTDRDEGLLDVKEEEANKQHKSIISALRATAPKWEFEQINFVVGNRGCFVESKSYTKLTKLDGQTGKKDKLFADHLTQVREAHDRVILSFFVAGARTCETNHRGIDLKYYCAQCARVRRCKEEHTITERQSWGCQTIVESG